MRAGRLVTVTGPGGSGKTRLALQVAAELTDEFEDGVFWVSLAAVNDPELLEPTISQTIGARHGLAAHVGEKRMLLLLDNFEQLVAGAPRLGHLLECCRDLHLLVTSGERDFEIDTLTEADAARVLAHAAPDLERGRDEGRRLPLDRAIELALSEA